MAVITWLVRQGFHNVNIIIIVMVCILHSNKLAANVFAKLKIVINKDTALFAIWSISFCEQESPDFWEHYKICALRAILCATIMKLCKKPPSWNKFLIENPTNQPMVVIVLNMYTHGWQHLLNSIVRIDSWTVLMSDIQHWFCPIQGSPGLVLKIVFVKTIW